MIGTGGSAGVALARSIARTGRPAGSEAERRARARCASHLESRGFDVAEHSFDYSAFPGEWGTAGVGTCLALAALGGAAQVVSRARGTAETMALSATLSLIAAACGWWIGRWGTRSLRVRRCQGVNLVGRRGVPGVWLVAHLDTKGQPVSLAMRACGVVLVAFGWLVTLGGWIVYTVGGPSAHPVIVTGLVAAGIGALPLAGSVVLDRGTGALDNASGIATIFETVDLLPAGVPVGIVLTTAEELGLAGARAWGAGEPPGLALNCDGVDDEGEIVCVVGRDRSGRLTRAINGACERTGTRVHRRRALPGVLFDSVALADAGWDTMTVARGTLRSLARVHTAGDTLAAWKGGGVADVAAFLAAVAGAVVAEQHAVQHGDHPARREE